jgi:hypothetical protein
MSDRADLVDAVVGAEDPRALDGTHASYLVAVALGAAGAAVAGRPKRPDRTRRTGAAAGSVALVSELAK